MSGVKRNRYRYSSIRKPGWDYGRDGYYYVTICTRNKFPFFGKLYNRSVILTDEGRIADKLWKEIPDHFSFAQVIKHIVMPDHVHGIIQINKTEDYQTDTIDNPFRIIVDNPDFQEETRNSDTPDFQVEARLIASLLENPGGHHHDLSNPEANHMDIEENDLQMIIDKLSGIRKKNLERGGFAGSKNPMLHDNLPRIIRWFKGRTTFECRKVNADFGWQSRYHDHIIRSEESLKQIRGYVASNPKRGNPHYFNI